MDMKGGGKGVYWIKKKKASPIGSRWRGERALGASKGVYTSSVPRLVFDLRGKDVVFLNNTARDSLAKDR